MTDAFDHPIDEACACAVCGYNRQGQDAENQAPPALLKLRARQVGRRPVGSLSNAMRLTTAEQRASEALEYPEDARRPCTRGECVDGPRPCPWVSCRYHLYLDVSTEGSLKLNHLDREVWELEESCTLDIADRGGETLERVGEILGVTRERVRQLEARALAKMGRRHPHPEAA